VGDRCSPDFVLERSHLIKQFFSIKVLTMTSSYLAIAQQGKNSWKRYLAGLSIIFGFSLVTMLPIMISSRLIWGIKSPSGGSFFEMLFSKNEYLGMLALAMLSNGGLAGLAVAIERLHQRKFLTLISSDNTIQWERVAQGLGLWLGLRFLGILICSVVIPSRYIFTFNIDEWLPSTLLAMICIPMICLGRHLISYAYLLQGMGIWLSNPSYLAIFWGLCISLMRLPLDPLTWLTEVASSVMICWIVLKNENRQELVMGFNCADLFSGHLFVKYDGSPLHQHTIFTFQGSSSPLLSKSIYLISLGLFYYFFFGRSQKHSASKS
jgi:uncharacterized protein